jgi:hypothetical protein
MSSTRGFLNSPEASGCADRYARRRPNVQTTTATVPAPTTSAANTATLIRNIVEYLSRNIGGEVRGLYTLGGVGEGYQSGGVGVALTWSALQQEILHHQSSVDHPQPAVGLDYPNGSPHPRRV